MNTITSRRVSFLALFFLTLPIAVPTPALAVTPEAIGDRFLVDTFASYPRVEHAFEKWNVSWLDYDSTNYPWLRQYNSAGIPSSEMFDFDPIINHADPAFATGADYILLVYTVGNSAAHFFHLAAVLFDPDGTQLDKEYIASHTSIPNTSFHNPAIANKPGTNEFMVVYREEEIVSTGIYGLAVSVNAGQIVVTGGPVEYWGTGDGALDIAFGRYEISPGFFFERYFAVFRAAIGGGEIRGQSIVPGTAAAWGANTIFPANGQVALSPAIASLEGDGESPMMVTWQRGAPTTTVVAQRITVDGSMQGSLITVASDVESPDVAASETEYLIVFHEPTLPSYQDRILGRYFDLVGNDLGDVFTIVDDDDLNSAPAVASDGVNYMVAYVTSPFSQTDVACQRVGPGAFTFVDGEVTDFGTDSRGVAWGDWFNFPINLADLFIGNAGTEMNLVFENDGEGVLDRHLNSGADEAVGGQGVAWADYDNDGKLDIYVSSGSGPNELYRWEFDGFHYFVGVGNSLGVDDAGNSRSIAWGDYDSDGLIDLYVGNKSSANRLYHNDGAGFSEVGGDLGVDDTGNCEGVAFIDFDNDNDLDIYVGNAGSENRLYENTGATFNEVAASWNLEDAGSARSVSWCDYDNDGDFDLYISKYNEDNTLYRNTGTSFQVVNAGVTDDGRGESACWADFDLDGDQDMFLANYLGADRFYRNNGVSFTEIGTIAGLDDGGGSLGAAWADVDGDGDPDLCVTGFGDENRIFRNDFNTDNNWLKVALEGVDANAAGIGSRVRVVAGYLVQVQDVGGRNGYLSQNELTLIFGLGIETMADSVIVRWPDGGEDIFTSVTSNQILQISEGSGATEVQDVPPSHFRILGNRPNPFNPRTEILFELPVRGEIELAIHDARGRRIALLAQGDWLPGRHTVIWNGTDDAGKAMASGVYYARLTAANQRTVQPLVLLK